MPSSNDTGNGPSPEQSRSQDDSHPGFASDILTMGYTSEVYTKGRLTQALFDELEFLGQTPKVYLPEVKAYLMKEEHALNNAVGRLLRQPYDQFLREQLCRASASPPSRSQA